jgi:hypothetical protein
VSLSCLGMTKACFFIPQGVTATRAKRAAMLWTSVNPSTAHHQGQKRYAQTTTNRQCTRRGFYSRPPRALSSNGRSNRPQHTCKLMHLAERILRGGELEIVGPIWFRHTTGPAVSRCHWNRGLPGLQV